MKTKKILSVALAILMLIGTFAVGASAAEQELKDTDIILAGEIISGLEESYWLTVDGALTSDGASAENYNVAITPATGDSATKVTLKNAMLRRISPLEQFECYALGSSDSLDIELQGTNEIYIQNPSWYFAYGIYSANDIGFYGDGSLEMNLGNDYCITANGIFAEKITFSGNAAVKLELSSICKIYGIYSEYGAALSDNTYVEINATGTSNPDAETMFAGSEYAEGITAIGFSSYGGLELSNNAKINVTVSGPKSEMIGAGGLIINEGLVLSENSHINATACDASEASYGISMNNSDLTVSGTSTVTANAGRASVSYGIYMYDGRSNKQYVRLSSNAKVTATANSANNENGGFYSCAELTASDNATLTASSGATLDGDSYGALIWKGATLSGNAQLKGVSGDAGGESHGVFLGNCLTVSDNSVVEGRAGNAKEKTVGLTAEGELLVNGKAKITAESKNSEALYTLALETESLKAYDDAQISAKSGEGIISVGVYTGESIIYGNAKINAEAGKASQISYGCLAEDNGIIIIDNASLTAVGNGGEYTFGVYVCKEFKVSGNAVVDVTAKDGAEQCMGIYAEGYLLATGNSNIKAISSTDAKFSVGLVANEMEIQNAATVEASGYLTAVYAAEDYKIIGYENGYIVVSTDTNPKNAVEYTNEYPLVITEADDESTEDSCYKYVFIAPEAPAEPEPELNFFEQIIASIVEFFNKIALFFSSIFSFGK